MGLQQVLAELFRLESDGVVKRYAIGGAVAATRYVAAAATEDVDVFVTFKGASAGTLAPLAPVYEYLVARGAKPEGGHVVIGGWPVQFLPAEGPLLEEAIGEAQEVDVDGQSTRVFTAEHLAAIALQVGRTKDKLRLVQMVESKALDLARFRAVLEHHDLTTKWEEFSRNLLSGQ